MKKLFESPVFALLLAVVVVIGSTLLNTRIKFCLFCLSLLSLYEEIFMRKSPRASFVK